MLRCNNVYFLVIFMKNISAVDVYCSCSHSGHVEWQAQPHYHVLDSRCVQQLLIIWTRTTPLSRVGLQMCPAAAHILDRHNPIITCWTAGVSSSCSHSGQAQPHYHVLDSRCVQQLLTFWTDPTPLSRVGKEVCIAPVHILDTDWQTQYHCHFKCSSL
jgi:hypothetical protein